MFVAAQKVKRAKGWIKLGFLVTYNFVDCCCHHSSHAGS